MLFVLVVDGDPVGYELEAALVGLSTEDQDEVGGEGRARVHADLELPVERERGVSRNGAGGRDGPRTRAFLPLLCPRDTCVYPVLYHSW